MLCVTISSIGEHAAVFIAAKKNRQQKHATNTQILLHSPTQNEKKNLTMSYDPPYKISIPTPSEIPKGFGPNSTGRRGGNLRIRCTNAEYDMLAEEAAYLGISIANFGRWCSVQVAQKLKEHRLSNSTAQTVGDNDDQWI